MSGLGVAVTVLARVLAVRVMTKIDERVAAGGHDKLDDPELRKRMEDVAATTASLHVQQLAGEDVSELTAILTARRLNLQSAASSHGLKLVDETFVALLTKAAEGLAG